MNTRVLLLGCLLALSVQAQETKRELWTWKDANGVTQYSDRPVPGATRVELKGIAPSPPSAAAASARADEAGAPEEPAAPVRYEALEIVEPQQDQSFFVPQQAVQIQLRSEPALAQGDRLQVYLDGQLLEGATNSFSYTLGSVERGTHSLVAAIVDEQGVEKIRSEQRVFHVRQPTVNPPRAVGPAVKPPPPKPQPR
jgi:hypothetical protein